MSGGAKAKANFGEMESDRKQEVSGNKKIAEIKTQTVESFRRNGIFFGPMIIDLLHNESLPIDPSAIPDVKTNMNIHINYLVTDKTDGERNLLFFDGIGRVYGIGRESTIKYYGVTMPSLANSILDGEYISRSFEEKILNNFYIFDIYIYKGENVMIKPFLFGRPNGRHWNIQEVVKYVTTASNIIQSNPKMPFLIYAKQYMPHQSPSSYEKLSKGEKPLISENCEKLLSKMNVKFGGYLEIGHLYPYKTDGLIFHPNNLAVYQTHTDDYVKNPFYKGVWKNSYKWKAASHLTIDFKIVYVKESGSKQNIYKYIGDKVYIKVNLITAVYQSKNANSMHNNKLNFFLLNSGIKIQNIPQDFKFFATNPFIGSYDEEGNISNYMGEAYFLLDDNENVLCTNGNFVTDGMICECSYDKTIEDELFRWVPDRIRADKSKPNGYGTAVTTWSLINNPITKEYLSGNSGTQNGDGDGDDGDKLVDITYYTNNQNTIILTEPLNKFNSFVKTYIINRSLNGYVKPKVLDLAVGVLGDMHKYAAAGVHTLVGIDINESNINNPIDGASTRIMTSQNPAISKLADKTILIVGTASKNVASGECVFDNINKYYIDVLYGRSKGNTPKLRKMESIALDGFDMVSCMYAIHYMMNNETDLDNFLRNVSENLLDQGYFIGTCLDGMEILKEMGNKDEINGEIDGKTVFFIRKENTDTNTYKNITVGNKITVYYEKFASAFSENLVNMSYLVEKAKSHNLKLIEFKQFLEEPGNMLNKYEKDGGKSSAVNVKHIKQSNALMTWAKFNSYFIFQKVRSNE